MQSAINDRLGAPVIASATAGGGFTRAFAAVVTTRAGDRAFLKAAPLHGPDAAGYARESTVTSLLPATVRAARPRWTMVAEDHFVVCLDAVDGHVPALPWNPAELDAALTAWHEASHALRNPSDELSAVGLAPLSEIVRHELSWWSEIAAGRVPMPPAPPWAADRIGTLASLEQELPALVNGTAMLHGDLRIDNTLIDGYGKAWLCDWAWPCTGQPWFDTVTLLVTAYASGLDADRLLEPWNAPAQGVDGALAAMGGYWLTRAAGGRSSASPHSRQHQRFSGGQALQWLAARRGWAS
ncbi:phosphotransferase family protein [Actinoplanes sp. NPDC051494]|uniref:phosphotransferase family protein n=1 Tax=Actinoplanes sp. NPDC051494 TaxID=3363907 RepID=UPI0037BDB419